MRATADQCRWLLDQASVTNNRKPATLRVLNVTPAEAGVFRRREIPASAGMTIVAARMDQRRGWTKCRLEQIFDPVNRSS